MSWSCYNNNDWSGLMFSLNFFSLYYLELGLVWCMFKCEMNVQQMEIKRLKEDMVKFKSEFEVM